MQKCEKHYTAKICLLFLVPFASGEKKISFTFQAKLLFFSTFTQIYLFFKLETGGGSTRALVFQTSLSTTHYFSCFFMLILYCCRGGLLFLILLQAIQCHRLFLTTFFFFFFTAFCVAVYVFYTLLLLDTEDNVKNERLYKK